MRQTNSRMELPSSEIVAELDELLGAPPNFSIDHRGGIMM